MEDRDVVRRDVQQEYDKLAPRYDRRWRHYIERSVEETIARIPPLPPAASVLDAGCGTGALLRELARRDADLRLTGLDLSAAMTAAGSEAAPHLNFVVGDTEALPFPSASFDLVVSSSSFHFWPSPTIALAELRRVLRAGGTVVITDWCDDFLVCRICDRWLRWTDPAYRQMFGTSELAALVRAAGFQLRSLDAYRISLFWGLMTAVARRSGET